ncbi:6085_t:CDS:2 [Acaulospora morrowiae]|uniref:6085_t:CDS:1 n=1 Tax=Acaulospora morrowiae TaxID=94023 RepID=A0A9N9BM15_9GLOM|nr:6085_t:CDS:2 [Acaulospora morrowiae]
MPAQSPNKKFTSKSSKSKSASKISSVRTDNKIFGVAKTTTKGKKVHFAGVQHVANKSGKMSVGKKTPSIMKRPTKKILREEIEEESEEDFESENEGFEEIHESSGSEEESENENLEENQMNLSSEEEEEPSGEDIDGSESTDDENNLRKDVIMTGSDGSKLSGDDGGDLDSEKPAAKRVKKEKPNQARIKAAFDRKKKGDRKLDPEYRLGLKECWEFARKIEISPEERKNYLKELFELIDGNIPELLFKHDTSRIIQTGLKYGTKEQINKIADELEGRWLEASKNKYAKFVVLKIMRCCPKYRDRILSELEGNVARLMMHAEARSVVLEAYELSNGKQRFSLIQEFYGPEFKLFGKTKCLSIDELVAEDPLTKDRIVESLSIAIQNFMKKPELLRFIIPHRVLLDFFTYANEIKIRSTIELIGKHVPEILHTREGARVAMICLTHASAKERKIILQSMKDYVKDICCEEYGYLVLLRAFDVVDDTVSLTKYIIDKIVKPDSFETISQNKYGHRVFLYLLTGRSKMYFSFDTLKLLSQDDHIREKTSKKDPTVRANELRKAISPALIEYAKNNTAHMLSNSYTTQLLFETMLCGESSLEEKRPTLENISNIISEKKRDDKDNIMTTYVNRFLKVLVQGRHRKYPKQTIAKKDDLPEGSESTVNRVNRETHTIDDKEEGSGDEKAELHFSQILFNTIKNDLLYYSCHVTASFVILALLEDEETKDEVKGILTKGIDLIRKAALEDERSGASLILKVLNESMSPKQEVEDKVKGTRKGTVIKQKTKANTVDSEKKGGEKRKKRKNPL